jgi:peroxiredoxin
MMDPRGTGKSGILELLLCLFLILFATALFSYGQDLPMFEAKTVDGDVIKFADLVGKKVILIDFWATYCIQCRPQLDKLDELYEKYKKDDFEVLIISVDTPQNVGKIKPYFKSRGYSFPVLLDTDSQISRVLKKYKGLPYTILVDKDGKIVYTHKGYKKGEEKLLEKKILACLKKAESEDESQ